VALFPGIPGQKASTRFFPDGAAGHPGREGSLAIFPHRPPRPVV